MGSFKNSSSALARLAPAWLAPKQWSCSLQPAGSCHHLIGVLALYRSKYQQIAGVDQRGDDSGGPVVVDARYHLLLLDTAAQLL